MSKEEKTVRYISKYAQLRIVLKPAYTSEQNGRVQTHAGHDVRFDGGLFETKDAELVKELEARPEFGSVFIRVPDDTDAMAHREEQYKDLETRQKELDAKEKELADREAKLNGDETGRTESADQLDDGLDALGRPALNEIAEEVGLDKEQYRVGVTNVAVVEAIRAKRAEEGTAPEGAEEGADNTDPAF